MNENEFDYPAFTRDTPPDPTSIRRGIAAHRQRIAEAIKRPTVRVDEDILSQFSEIAAPGQSTEQTINHALREWLAAQTMKELLRTELQAAVQQAFLQVNKPEALTKVDAAVAIEEC
jgi:uncharacterized protein (DUF4415 family)